MASVVSSRVISRRPGGQPASQPGHLFRSVAILLRRQTANHAEKLVEAENCCGSAAAA